MKKLNERFSLMNMKMYCQRCDDDTIHTDEVTGWVDVQFGGNDDIEHEKQCTECGYSWTDI